MASREPRRLLKLFAVDARVEVKATWGIYQQMIAAYRVPDRTQARARMTALIDSLA